MEWTFLWPPSVPGERSGSEPSNHCFPGFLPGTVVAAGGPPVPFGRSRWKQLASTWNSDRGNGRFCCRLPFQVKGRSQSRLIIPFQAFHWARSSPLGDRRFDWPFQVEAKYLHLELRPGNGRFWGRPPFQVACHGFDLFQSLRLQVAWRKWIASAKSRSWNANHNVRSSALTETGSAVCVCCRHLLILRHPEPDMTLAETGGHIQYIFILDERKEETCDVRYGWCPVRHYAATRPSLEYCVQ